jgi:hypothetical protein
MLVSADGAFADVEGLAWMPPDVAVRQLLSE